MRRPTYACSERCVDNSQGYFFNSTTISAHDDDFDAFDEEGGEDNSSKKKGKKKEHRIEDNAWYETLRIALEPYRAVRSGEAPDEELTTGEIIQAVELHHGIAQSDIMGMRGAYVGPDDFVKAMRKLGYQETNAGGLVLVWPVKKKLQD